jgi:uncharacterized protein
MNIVTTFLSALLFALGLGLAGMTNPDNIIGFLNIFGDWQPALLLVMLAAVLVYAVSYRLIVRRSKPLLSPAFVLPTKTQLDRPLLMGSLLFGIGWGLGGYCPGPAVVALVSLQSSTFYFVVSMLLGIAIYHYLFVPRPVSLAEQKESSARPVQAKPFDSQEH